MRTTKSTKLASLGVAWLQRPLALVFTLVLATLAFSASPALAENPSLRDQLRNSFTNPNGIAVEESTGDVYVADIGTDTVSRFDADGNPVEFPALHSNVLTGAATPAGSFSFPSVYGSPAAIAVDNSSRHPSLTGKACEEFDPSAGDLYVMDSGHGVIDKFSPEGRYLSQIGGFEGEELLGLGVDGSGTVHVDLSGEVTAGRRIRRRGRESSDRSPGFACGGRNWWRRGCPPNSGPTASPSPPRAMTTRCTNRRARVRRSSGRSSPCSAAWRTSARSGRRRGGRRPRDRPPLRGRSVLRGRVGHGRDEPQQRCWRLQRRQRWHARRALRLGRTFGDFGPGRDCRRRRERGDLRLQPGQRQGLRLRQRRPRCDSRRTGGCDQGSREPERHGRSARRRRQRMRVRVRPHRRIRQRPL